MTLIFGIYADPSIVFLTYGLLLAVCGLGIGDLLIGFCYFFFEDFFGDLVAVMYRYFFD